MSDESTVEEIATDASEDETLTIVSILGGSRRVGRWRIPASTSVMAVFGRTTLDLREVDSQATEVEIRCLSVFAGVTILVPKGELIKFSFEQPKIFTEELRRAFSSRRS